MLYGSETSPVKEEDVIRLCYKNDARIVRRVCKVRPENWISTEEVRARLKLKSMRACVQDRRLQWFSSRLAVESPEENQEKQGMR